MKDNLTFFKNKKILVIGLGKTGVSVINKISPIVRSVTGIDNNPNINLSSNFSISGSKGESNVKIILGEDVNYKKELLNDIDLIIISPGVPSEIPLIKYSQEMKIPIWSEVELAWNMMTKVGRKNTIAVTGTNGKTTVVSLIGKILQDAGMAVQVCGNIGNPIIDTINDNSKYNTVRVIEVSSFQLERVYKFAPHISIILNITSDHMDRHLTIDNYTDLKFKLFSCMSCGDFAIFNIDDDRISKRLEVEDYYKRSQVNVINYGFYYREGVNLWHENNKIFYKIKSSRGRIDIKKIFLQGNHNISNIMASVAAVKLFNVDDGNIENTLKKFKPLYHRLEYLGVTDEIRCFNDSKSTNPDSAIKALSNFDKEVTLIMGGMDKNMNFETLIPFLNQKVNNLIIIGEVKLKIFNMVKKYRHGYKVYMCQTLEDAVEKGFKTTSCGEVLLLSPACASMDMFKDYRERGERFKYLVKKRKSRQ